MAGRKVIGFYSSRPSCAYPEFSNFFRHSAPYDFRLPEFVKRPGFPDAVSCSFSEKAIMVMKAALMDDRPTFDKMLRVNDPAAVKKLGRQVKGFDDKLWQRHLEKIAFEAVFQKFSSCDRLREKLLSTGDCILAEATVNDRIWGIGLDVGDPRVQDRTQWQGRNILGKALMDVRSAFKEDNRGGSAADRPEAEAPLPKRCRTSAPSITPAVSVSPASEAPASVSAAAIDAEDVAQSAIPIYGGSLATQEVTVAASAAVKKQLLEMGFTQERVCEALKHHSTCEDAVEWLSTTASS
eukprot:TRINITY_DN63815_c0_g1_i1.p1 TRINITY_DN63815_c0_g1~~TRINITY_DN63815_c0_g1_i1.p1  ORF type:complete len:295 (+),score=44.18 TRINITY_DN63815_c0_g1_i1:56-940(+)